ncbi:MAG: hypothetical protein IMY68_11895 [Bacteroidetes bacterium]|nr:hypothetical protein [Bacteroidota bacterium]
MPDELKFRALTGEDWKDILNTKLLYEDGLEGGLTLKKDETDGSYVSPLLNSGIPECQWHRITLKADIPENATITVLFSTSDHKGSNDDESQNWYGSRVFKKTVKDALIQAPPGQYLRLKIDLHREGEDERPLVLQQVKVYYPRLSYLRYLPEVYQENSESREFLERYLSLFESALYDSEECISRIPHHFDPIAASEEFYRWLADWVSLDLYELLTDEKKREFILKAVEFYKQKGTVSGLASLVSFLTKEKKCCIKEYKNNVFRSYQVKHDSVFELEPADMKCKDHPGINDECQRFYHGISRTFDISQKVNKGEYCDKMHYVTGKSKEETRKEIHYFSNFIGIFVFLPFKEEKEEFKIKENELYKIIYSFLPVFVRAHIKFVLPPITEPYPLNWIKEHFSDVVTDLLAEQMGIVSGEYIDEIPGWKRFYTYFDYEPDNPRKQKIPPYGYGRTYKEDSENKEFRTVHEAIGFTYAI